MNLFTDDTLSMDQRLLKLILQNHILKVKVGLSDLYNGQILETIGGKQLRVFVYRTVGESDLIPIYTGLNVTWHMLVEELSLRMFLTYANAIVKLSVHMIRDKDSSLEGT